MARWCGHHLDSRRSGARRECDRELIAAYVTGSVGFKALDSCVTAALIESCAMTNRVQGQVWKELAQTADQWREVEKTNQKHDPADDLDAVKIPGPPGRRQKYRGVASLGTRLYAAPSDAADVLVIDSESRTASTIPLEGKTRTPPGGTRKRDFGVALTGSCGVPDARRIVGDWSILMFLNGMRHSLASERLSTREVDLILGPSLRAQNGKPARSRSGIPQSNPPCSMGPKPPPLRPESIEKQHHARQSTPPQSGTESWPTNATSTARPATPTSCW